MALDPMSLERFVQLSQEEGVPLEVSVPFFVVESSTGADKNAYIPPSERAGKNNFANVTADRIGYGPMQVIQSTYKQVMGKDAPYETASVEDLTRAGLKYIKTKAGSDGTYDMTKLMPQYFGPGNDASFGTADKPYNPTTQKGPKVLSIANAIINAKLSGEDFDVAKIIKENAKDNIDPRQASVFVKQAQVAGLEQQINNAEAEAANAAASGDNAKLVASLQAQGEAAQAKQSAMYDMLMGMSKANAQQNSQILDAFKQNPAGVFASLAKSSETISKMQDRLNTEVAYANMEFQPDNTGFAGFLEAAFKNFAGKMNAPQTAASLKQLTDAQAQVNNAVKGALENASAGQINPTTAISAMNAATNLAKFEFDTSKASANLEAKLSEAQAKTERAQFLAAQKQNQLELTNQLQQQRFLLAQQDTQSKIAARDANDERRAKESEANLRKTEAQTTKLELQVEFAKLNGGFTSKRIEAINSFADINKHIEKMNETLVANGQTPWPLVQSKADFEIGYKNNKPRLERLQRAMASGNYSLAGKTFSEAYRSVIGQLSIPEQRVATDLSRRFDRAKVFADLMKNEKGFEWLQPKQQESMVDTVIDANIAREVKKPRDSSNFVNDSRNLGLTYGQMIEIDAPDSIKQTLSGMGISPSSISSDMEFFSKIAYAMTANKLSVPREQLQEDIATMYLNHVKTAAKQDSVYAKLGIQLPSNSYIVEDKLKGKVTRHDLTDPAYVQSYLNKVIGAVDERKKAAGGTSGGFFSFGSR